MWTVLCLGSPSPSDMAIYYVVSVWLCLHVSWWMGNSLHSIDHKRCFSAWFPAGSNHSYFGLARDVLANAEQLHQKKSHNLQMITYVVYRYPTVVWEANRKKNSFWTKFESLDPSKFVCARLNVRVNTFTGHQITHTRRVLIWKEQINPHQTHTKHTHTHTRTFIKAEANTRGLPV